MFIIVGLKVLFLFLFFIVKVYCSVMQQYITENIENGYSEIYDSNYIDINSYNVKLFYNAANSENSCSDSSQCSEWCKNYIKSHNWGEYKAHSCDKYAGNFQKTCTCFFQVNAGDGKYFNIRGVRDGPA
jgi:hypothetical protein